MSAYRKLASLTGLIVLLASLAGCATLTDNRTSTYELQTPDPGKGVVAGTLFLRTEFLSGDNATLSLWGPGKYEIIGLWLRRFSKSPYDFSESRGLGRAFALQLAPGRYKLDSWGLYPGGKNAKPKYSGEPETAVEFEVVAGKTIYIGRFDADRLLEVASFHDNLANDLIELQKIPALDIRNMENHALNVRGWWLKDTVGKEILRRAGNLGCPQC